MELFTLGGTAGTIGWLLASPADVINSRRQGRVSPADRPLVPPPSSVVPMSLLTEMRHVATTEGTHVLWTGMRFQVARGFVGQLHLIALELNGAAVWLRFIVVCFRLWYFHCRLHVGCEHVEQFTTNPRSAAAAM